jgi:hypothetical protein
MPKILLVGQDEGLLETRCAVLKRTGAVVVSYIGNDALKVVQSEMPDLVVLCHSLAADIAEVMADEVRRCCPKARILLVLSELGGDRSYKDTKFDATSPARPSKLIERATELLRTPPHHLMEEITNDTYGSSAC